MSNNKLDFIPGTTKADGDIEHVHARQYEYFKPEDDEKTKKAKAKAKKELEAKRVKEFNCNHCKFGSDDETVIKKHVKTCKPKKVKDESSGDGKKC